VRCTDRRSHVRQTGASRTAGENYIGSTEGRVLNIHEEGSHKVETQADNADRDNTVHKRDRDNAVTKRAGSRGRYGREGVADGGGFSVVAHAAKVITLQYSLNNTSL
jgi:hypothetical protein